MQSGIRSSCGQGQGVSLYQIADSPLLSIISSFVRGVKTFGLVVIEKGVFPPNPDFLIVFEGV
ncbi:hypothetical protein LEP1GSC005_1357 [Leptospira santarosai str. ST188]|nr:hypothetical protein LEP1GSC005_1357 [Leptospira santarosai str. ST188]EMO31522.1 hypothetical protein LEP1GSC175_0997 [Leptospira santarosai str. HAI821]